MLADPNPDDPLDTELAAIYKRSREEYEKKVRDAVVEHAIPLKYMYEDSSGKST
jgi:ubiquitin-protein ligase